MAAGEAGWFPDASDPRLERWWDGTVWTTYTRLRAGSAPVHTPHFGTEARSSSQSGVEVKAVAKEGTFGKAWSHAITTAVGVIVTALVTGVIGQQKQREIKLEGGRGMLKSQEIISDLLTSQKAAQAELVACRTGQPAPPNETASTTARPLAPVSVGTADVSLDGNWFTPDGAVVWEIRGTHASFHSTGNLSGFVQGTAELAQQGTLITGSLNATTYYGLLQGRASLTAQVQGDFINGTIQEPTATTPLVLVCAR